MRLNRGMLTIMEHALLLLLLMSCTRSWPICAASRLYAVTLRKSKSSTRSKSKTPKKSRIKVGGLDTSGSSLVIIAIVVAVIVILILIYWWWRWHSARKYIRGTEKLAAKYSIHARDIGEPELRLFNHEEMKQATDCFASERVLGHGRFGDVYKGVLDDETEVAIKSVKTSSFKGKDQVLSEVQLLSKANHAHIIRLLGFCVRWKRLLLVYEYAPNGSLSDRLVQKVDGTAALDWKARLQIALQSVQALAYLHSEHGPICHGDVKSNNILLDQSMNAKVSDYGLLRFVGQDHINLASKCVQISSGWPWISFKGHKTPHASTEAQVLTAGYLDQSNINIEVTDQSDVYNFGVVLLELVTSQRTLQFSSTGQEEDDDVNVVEMVQMKKEQGKLEEVFDAELVRGAPEWVQSMRSVVDLAMDCVNANGLDRPPLMMKEVADRLESIIIMSSLS